METTEASTSSINGVLGLLQTGGPVVGVLLALSVIALTIMIYKAAQFAMSGVGRHQSALRAVSAYRNGDAAKAIELVRAESDPVSRSVAIALRGRFRSDLGDDAVREEVARQATQDLEALRRHIGILELIGSLSPLIGLLGTVIGMIQAFQAMEQAGSNVDPAVLSGGIWVALLTTAAGLIVAIPVVTVATWLDRSVNAVAVRIEDAVTAIFAPNLTAPSTEADRGAQLATA